MFEPTVRGNIETLAQRITRAGVAPLGPVSIGPGEGHIRLNDGTHDTGYLDFNGLQIRYRGALTGLTWLTESFADSVEAHSGRLDGHDGDVARIDAKNGQQDGRLDGHDATVSSHGSRISSAEGRLDGLDSAVAAKASSEWVSGQLGQLSTSLSKKAATTYVDTVNDKANSAITAAATAQSRADSAWTRAGTGIANAATAQARADSAHGLAVQANNAVQALRAEVHDWMQSARVNDPGLPAPIPR